MSEVPEILTATQVISEPETARILLVEKDISRRSQLNNALVNKGYSVQGAESVWEAFEKLIDYRFDLMMGNANLPGTSNLDLVRYCKKRHPAMEIIVLSENPQVPEAVELIKEGAFDYIESPIDDDLLHSKVEAAISQQKNKLIKMLTGYDSSFDENMINPLPSCDIIKQLGCGSTGAVFLVKRNNEKYALKILRPDLSPKLSRKIANNDFLREAKLLSKINNTNIVSIFEYGVSGNNMPYILMEYVHGHALTKYIKENKLTLNNRLQILLQICQALNFIHKSGVLHRDLKPGNIMIAKDHTAKLTDFGIAHKIDPSQEQKPEEITGSPAYMAPEGFEKTSPFDKRSDIFSFGVVAYELLTGKKPFKGKNVPELLHSISNSKPIEPQKLNPEIPDSIQSLMARTLNKRPEDRIQNMSEAIKILEKHLKPKTKLSSPKPQKFISRFINAASRAWS